MSLSSLKIMKKSPITEYSDSLHKDEICACLRCHIVYNYYDEM